MLGNWDVDKRPPVVEAAGAGAVLLLRRAGPHDPYASQQGGAWDAGCWKVLGGNSMSIYLMTGRLGSGGFGDVFRALRVTRDGGELCAVPGKGHA